MAISVLDELKRLYPTAKVTTLRDYGRSGRVFVNGAQFKRLGDPLPAGATVEVRPETKPAASEIIAEELNWGVEIVSENDDFVVVNKPPGLLTSTNDRERRPTLLAWLQVRYADRNPPVRLGVIHRLDKEASGLLVFSKNQPTFEHLKSELFHRKMKRQYLAAAQGQVAPAEGTVDSWLVEHADGRVHICRKGSPKGDSAITHYRTIDFSKERVQSLLEITLETGRKHQIRAHLASIGHPIVGDVMYGATMGVSKRRGAVPWLRLFAYKLEFVERKSGRELKFQLPTPNAFWHTSEQ